MRFLMRCLLVVPLVLTAGGVVGCKDSKAAVSKWLCDPCGVVESVVAKEIKGDGTGKGAIVGAIVGGVVGHQFGSGKGNDAATVVGAGAGAVAGNAIEKDMNKHLLYVVDRKSTRLNSSHPSISYAVFCLKKKKRGALARNLVYLASMLRVDRCQSRHALVRHFATAGLASSLHGLVISDATRRASEEERAY